MRVVVFGAAGRTGRLIVEQALGHGHDVTAFVHSAPLAVSGPNLSVVRGDAATDADAVAAAIEGTDAVAFALAIGGRGNPHVHEQAIANVVYGMALHGVRKVAAVSSAGVGERRPAGFSAAIRSLARRQMDVARDDLAAMERRLMASDLDWTIVRAYGLSDGPKTGAYRMTRDGSGIPGHQRVSRADVAGVVLAALETHEYDRRVLTVAG